MGIDPAHFSEPQRTTVIPQHQALLSAARAAGVQVVYTTLAASRDDYRDVLPAARENVRRLNARAGTRAVEVPRPITPQRDDLVFVKSGSSSFHTTPLDRCLRNLEVDTLLYTGVLTHACVLATAIAGFDLGHRGILVADCTATATPRAQALAEEAALPFVERPVDAADAIEALHRTGVATPIRTSHPRGPVRSGHERRMHG